MTLNVPSDLWIKYREAADFFIDELGVASTVVYPPKREDCSNCTQNRMQGGGNTSVYRKGGPLPYGGGNCPYCDSKGYKEVEQTDNVTLRVYWTKKDWLTVAQSIQVPDADVMIIGYLSDLPKIRRATEIILVSDQKKYGTWRFTVAVEPFPHGFKKDRYFISFLKRTG